MLNYPRGKIEANKRYHFDGSFMRIYYGDYGKDIDNWYFLSNGLEYKLPTSISPILHNLFSKYICGKRVPLVINGLMFFSAYTYCCMYNGKQEDVNLYLVTYEEKEFENGGKKIKYIPLNLEIEINGKKGFILLNGVYLIDRNKSLEDFSWFYRKYKLCREQIYGIDNNGKYYFINKESDKNKIKRTMKFIEDLPCNYKNLDKLIDFNLISKYNIDDIKMEIVEE